MVLLMAPWLSPVQAAELALKAMPVAPDVYAIIGDLGGRTYENEGLNNNLGFVVTEDGVCWSSIIWRTSRCPPAAT